MNEVNYTMQYNRSI